MNKIIVSILVGLISLSQAFAQMNFQDSSVQIISYWDLGEKYEYSISHQRMQYGGEGDTLLNESMTYEVEVSVIDSASDAYIVSWLYKNFKSDSKNPYVQKLASVSEDIAIEIKLDELGMIEGIVNWEEVRDYMSAAFDTLLRELPNIPDLKKMVSGMKANYSSKESIEASAIQDAQQFHNFHGGKFTLNEKVRGQIQTANIYFPDKPFDTEVLVMVEELDEKNNEYRIRSINEVNATQLADATYQYLSNTLGKLNPDLPTREDFNDLSNSIETVSRIHNTGWVLESILWKEFVSNGITHMEIRSIRMK
ncbi:MAG: hypothetical protein AAF696_05725 [Bacteroidota bacterium]